MLSGNGLCGEIVHAISAAAGLKSEIKFSPLKRLISDDGNNDLGNPVFYMRNQSFAAIIPIAIYKVSFVYYRPHHKQEITINNFDDLKKYKIGVLKGTLEDRVAKASIEKFSQTRSMISSLLKLVMQTIPLRL